MPAEKSNLLTDGVGTMDAGINSGIAPIRLEPNQAAFAINTSFRGGFPHTRPPFNRQDLNFGGNDELEAIFKTQLFQGATTYLDDFGNTFIVASIGGVVVLFTPNAAAPWTVTDVSIPGDPNSSNSSQVFMWQSEKWIIIQDGVNLPIFFDGTTSRRSLGATKVVATITNGPYNVPPADGTTLLAMTISAPYTSLVNIPLRRDLNGAFYQVVNNSVTVKGFQAIIAQNSAPGTTVPVGVQIIVPAIPTRILNQLSKPFSYSPGGALNSSPMSVSNLSAPPYNSNFKLVINGITFTIDQLRTFGTRTSTTENQDLACIYLEIRDYLVPYLYGTAAYNFWITNTLTPYGFCVEPKIKNAAPLGVYYVYSGSSFSTIPTGTTIFDTNPPTPAYPVAVVRTAFTLPATNTPLTIDIDSTYVGVNQSTVLQGVVNGSGNVITAVITATPLEPPIAGVVVSNTNDIPFGSVGTADIAAGETFSTIAELPIGRMGIYGRARNWVVLQDGRSFVAGDIVGGASGTVAFNNRDAVLRVVENDFLAGGGAFGVPGTAGEIKAIKLCAILDASLGQGPIQVFTPEIVFSVDAPFDRTTWSKLTNPILTESLIGTGALGQNSTISANSDTLFRSIQGVSSLILARRDFTSWGNVPLSREVEIVMEQDAGNLLQFSSAIIFSNRLLMTCFPGQGPLGVYHQGMVVIDFAPVSSLRGKAASIWEGYWSGLNVLQLLTAQFNFTQRAFSFCYSVADAAIQLFELLPDRNTLLWDNGTSPIQSSFETPVLFKPRSLQNMPFYRLEDGEIRVEQLFGVVSFAVWFRPDDSTCWTFWHGWSVCSDPNLASGIPQYRPSMGFGEPPNDCDPILNTPRREGYYFQLRVQVTGNCEVKFVGAKVSLQPQPKYATAVCSDIIP